MRKIVLAFAVILFAATSAFASLSDSNTKLDKNDMATIFGDAKVEKISLLSDNEMENTKGEFIPVFLMLSFSYASYANAPSFRDRLYSGMAYDIGKRKSRMFNNLITGSRFLW